MVCGLCLDSPYSLKTGMARPLICSPVAARCVVVLSNQPVNVIATPVDNGPMTEEGGQ
jgi:hypothetical protein